MKEKKKKSGRTTNIIFFGCCTGIREQLHTPQNGDEPLKLGGEAALGTATTRG